uniref:Uncharacterized protein n=1 Tax=Candidatus Kentrum sp. SD TaxID=2126332 RepID=A0A451BPM2_9GAMM|nr:MAG: hypothetical protein BECKSD772D_GA0070982_10957 [Candidatus Kentron sp. SD]
MKQGASGAFHLILKVVIFRCARNPVLRIPVFEPRIPRAAKEMTGAVNFHEKSEYTYHVIPAGNAETQTPWMAKNLSAALATLCGSA